MTRRPKDLTGRPTMTVSDVVSDVLATLRLTGEVLFTTRFTAPFAVSSPSGDLVGPVIMPGARCFAAFHVVTQGGCWLDLDGMSSWELGSTDVVVIPRGDAHAMRSSSASNARSIIEMMPPSGLSGCPEIVHGGDGEVTSLVCGFLACHHRFNPMIASLPRVIRIRKRGAVLTSSADGRGAPIARSLPSDVATWFDASLEHALVELSSTRIGGRAVVARLLELLFVEVLRSCVASDAPREDGWLAALADPRVGPALAALHADPARSWTIDDLARRSGTSRSILAQRFTALLGEPPMRYLARWRAHLAAKLLLETDEGIAEIAARVGFGSEAAFTRMFSRITGEPPSTFRQRERGQPASGSTE